ncbi:MAG: dephospho-CoA kinase [Bacteroidota bacterium]
MIKVGLTGNIGSGKTLVSEIFQVLRIPVYNADTRAGAIMEMPSVADPIIKIFDEDISSSQGKPDKKKIAEIVFADKLKLEKLNKIIHPLVIADFELWMKEQKNVSYIIMESAILFETNYSSLFDKIIFVSAPESLRLKRVMDRDGVDAEHIKNRILQQLPENKKIKKADFVIFNNDRKALIPQVLSIHENLITLYP